MWLFVFDMDGTILTDRHTLLDSTYKAIQDLQGLGARVLLASGRPPLGMEFVLRELGIPPCYIALNGALLVEDDRVLYEKEIPLQDFSPAIHLAKEKSLSVGAFCNREWIVEDVTPKVQEEARIVGFAPRVGCFSELTHAHKILVNGEVEAIQSYQRQLREETSALHIATSSPSYCEIVSQGVSKASALRVACEHLKVPSDRIVAFGDGENDVEMLEMARISVGMANARKMVLDKVDMVTKSNNEDGIYLGVVQVLERISSLSL